jgi:BASS family bile acid:Na+ symporter
MAGRKDPVALLAHFMHKAFIWLLLVAYAAAGLWPGPGLRLRRFSLGEIAFMGEKVNLSLSLGLLAFLLFNAGLGVDLSRLRGLLRQPLILAAGLAANFLIPLTFLFFLSLALHFWHDVGEAQSLLVGLALVASMPVAGSSAAWSQRGNGDLAVSLGLVLGSTLLSPLTTPLALHATARMASGEYAQALERLASSGTGAFLILGVVLPSLLGVAVRCLLGEARMEPARVHLKLATSLVLLVLCYTNAALSLPQALAEHDWDFLAMLAVVAFALCGLAFGAGAVLARLLKTDQAQRTALMYGLGMNNNGTSLVLAGATLAMFPRVLLPVIIYNLVQHLVAGAVGTTLPESPPVEGPASRVTMAVGRG